MRRLSIAQKLILICAAFLLPLVVQLYFMLDGLNQQIDRAQSEIDGNRLVTPVRVLLTRLPEHGRLTHLTLKGGASPAQQMASLRTEIDRAFRELHEGTARRETAFRLDPKELASAGRERVAPASLQGRWETLRDGWRTRPAEDNDSAVKELMADLNLLLQQIGEASGLYQDPDLDSFYVMDTSIRALQRVNAQIALALYVGTTAPGGPGRSPEVRGRLMSTGQQLRDVNLARVREQVGAAIREDARTYGTSEKLQTDVPVRLAAFAKAIGHFVGLMDAGGRDAAKVASTEAFLAAGEKARHAGIELWDSLSTALEDLLLRRMASMRQQRLVALSLSLAALAVAVGIAAAVARAITRPLDRVMAVAARVGAGDLAGARAALDEADDGAGRASADRDEVARLSRVFSEMTVALEALLRQVGQTGSRITSSVSRISTTARQLDAAIVQQATATTEVSATSREMSGSGVHVAESMTRLTAMVAEAAELADAGRAAVAEIQGVMRSQLGSIGAITARLAAIRKTTDRIATVVKTISEVAEHVQLLSLNAAIEGEKAGDAGSGFVIVAREMKRLADRTGRAALEIGAMADAMRTAVGDGVAAADEHAERTRAGGATVDLVSQKLRGVIDRTRELGPHIQGVDESVHGQAVGVQHISEAMRQLTGAAVQTRDAVHEFSAVVEELTRASRELDAETSRFRAADA